jgi:hypothetical protein
LEGVTFEVDEPVTTSSVIEFYNCTIYFVEISEFHFVCRDSWEFKCLFAHTGSTFSLIVVNVNSKFYFEILFEEKRLI